MLLILVGSARAADLDVTLRSVTAPCEAGPPQGGAYVVRYTSGGLYIDDRITDANGVASWTGIGASTYLLEVYSSSGELWARESVVVSGATTAVTLLAGEPFCTDSQVHAGATDVTGGTVLPGTELTFTIIVRNCSDHSRRTRVRLRVDRDAMEPFDFEELSPEQAPMGTGTTRTVNFTYTPVANGEYSINYMVESEIFDTWYMTDWGEWQFVVDVEPPPPPTGDLVVTVRDIIDPCDTGPPTPDAYVSLETPGGTLIRSGSTDANGMIMWSDIDNGSYRLAVAAEDALWLQDISVTIEGGVTTESTLVRREPYALHFGATVMDADVLGGFIHGDEHVSMTSFVRNCTPFREVTVRLWLDRDQQAPWDFEMLFPSEEMFYYEPQQFNTTFQPEIQGTYSAKFHVETLLGGYEVTDVYGWETAFTVTCDEDINLDGVVDVNDLLDLVLDWGTDGSEHGSDLDGSGLVDVDDLLLVLTNWGPCS
jgi:hypothetical protein